MLTGANIIIAKQLMYNMMIANGAINAIERDTPQRYKDKWVNKIAIAAGIFFDTNPDLLNDEVLNELADGDADKREEMYGQLVGYKELDDVLNKYFDTI